jgi:hypothetical protein
VKGLSLLTVIAALVILESTIVVQAHEEPSKTTAERIDD